MMFAFSGDCRFHQAACIPTIDMTRCGSEVLKGARDDRFPKQGAKAQLRKPKILKVNLQPRSWPSNLSPTMQPVARHDMNVHQIYRDNAYMTNIFVKPNHPNFSQFQAVTSRFENYQTNWPSKVPWCTLAITQGCFKEKYIWRGYQKPQFKRGI